MGKGKWPKGSNDCRAQKSMRCAMAALWCMTDRQLEETIEYAKPDHLMTEDQRIEKRACEILLQPEYRARRARTRTQEQP